MRWDRDASADGEDGGDAGRRGAGDAAGTSTEPMGDWTNEWRRLSANRPPEAEDDWTTEWRPDRMATQTATTNVWRTRWRIGVLRSPPRPARKQAALSSSGCAQAMLPIRCAGVGGEPPFCAAATTAMPRFALSTLDMMIVRSRSGCSKATANEGDRNPAHQGFVASPSSGACFTRTKAC